MRTKRTLYLFALAFGLGAGSHLLADGPTFTQIDFPGAASTQVWGISANSDIVGGYVATDNSTHGFLRTRGEFVSIDFPGAAYTYVYGISPHGDVVGLYAATVNGSGPSHGFVLSRDGVFKTVDYPGAASTTAVGMNSRGDVVGTYSNSDNLRHTFVMNADYFSPGGQFKAIDDYPGSTQTVAFGIRGDDIFGGAPIGSTTHGFVLSDGTYTTFDVAGATFNIVYAINASGQMVGRYTLDGVNHGYLRSGGQFATIDYPGAILTVAAAISSNGDILGRFQDANNVYHGFLLTGFKTANACASGN